MANYKGDQTTGFASPAADHVDQTVDLTGILDLQRPSRYPVRVSGDTLRHRGIRHGDILIVDTALPPSKGLMVIASVGDEMRVCEIWRDREQIWWLRPSTMGDSPIAVNEEADVAVWAVVTALVRQEV